MKSKELKLPEGWKWVKLGGEACEINPNYKLQAGKVYKFVPMEAVSEELYKVKFYTRVKWNGSGVKFALGDILLARITPSAENGKTAIIDFLNKHEYGFGSTEFIVFSPKDADSFFIYYIIKWDKVRSRLISQMTGTSGRQRIPNYAPNRIKIPLPPLPGQQKIAEILETVDNAIEKTEKIIEKYKRIKQGLMQELLTKGIDENWQIRSEKTHKFKDSPLGRIPEEWEVVRLGEVANVKGGKRLPKGDDFVTFKTPFPYIRLIDIKDMSIDLQAVKYIQEKTWKKIRKYTISKDDIMLSIAGNVGLIALIPEELDGANLTENAAKITNINKFIDRKFLAYCLTFYKTQQQIETFMGIVAQPKLALFRIKQIKVPLPPLPEQQRIAKILSQIDEVIEKEENYKRKLESLKRGLMEDLLTGKVRVNKLLEEV